MLNCIVNGDQRVYTANHLPYDIKVSIYHSLARIYDAHNCPYSRYLLDLNYEESAEDFKNVTLFQDMLAEANEKLIHDEPFVNFINLWDIVDTYECLSFSYIGDYIPLSPEFIAGVEDVIYTALFDVFNKRDEGARISSHPYLTFLDRVISHQMDEGTPTPSNKDIEHVPLDRKYYLFSGHDTTLATYLSALNHTVENSPPFASR